MSDFSRGSNAPPVPSALWLFRAHVPERVRIFSSDQLRSVLTFEKDPWVAVQIIVGAQGSPLYVAELVPISEWAAVCEQHTPGLSPNWVRMIDATSGSYAFEEPC